jgi:hypothetical protein
MRAALTVALLASSLSIAWAQKAGLGGVPRTLPVTEIVRVWLEGDSLTSGAIIGGAIGIPVGVLSCQGSVTENCNVLGRAVLGAVLYGAIGAWIDSRHHGRTVIYREPRP